MTLYQISLLIGLFGGKVPSSIIYGDSLSLVYVSLRLVRYATGTGYPDLGSAVMDQDETPILCRHPLQHRMMVPPETRHKTDKPFVLATDKGRLS